jgi:hypothetical protein
MQPARKTFSELKIGEKFRLFEEEKDCCVWVKVSKWMAIVSDNVGRPIKFLGLDGVYSTGELDFSVIIRYYASRHDQAV